jgi:hypothetical protein
VDKEIVDFGIDDYNDGKEGKKKEFLVSLS